MLLKDRDLLTARYASLFFIFAEALDFPFNLCHKWTSSVFWRGLPVCSHFLQNASSGILKATKSLKENPKLLKATSFITNVRNQHIIGTCSKQPCHHIQYLKVLNRQYSQCGTPSLGLAVLVVCVCVAPHHSQSYLLVKSNRFWIYTVQIQNSSSGKSRPQRVVIIICPSLASQKAPRGVSKAHCRVPRVQQE